MSAIAAGLSSGQIDPTQKLPLHGTYGSSQPRGEKVGSGKKRKEIKKRRKQNVKRRKKK
tara:strand:+ start:294 stop:470 length:177 start_codon:yes stop_codon:yes gene_type:complete